MAVIPVKKWCLLLRSIPRVHLNFDFNFVFGFCDRLGCFTLECRDFGKNRMFYATSEGNALNAGGGGGMHAWTCRRF